MKKPWNDVTGYEAMDYSGNIERAISQYVEARRKDPFWQSTAFRDKPMTEAEIEESIKATVAVVMRKVGIPVFIE